MATASPLTSVQSSSARANFCMFKQTQLLALNCAFCNLNMKAAFSFNYWLPPVVSWRFLLELCFLAAACAANTYFYRVKRVYSRRFSLKSTWTGHEQDVSLLFTWRGSEKNLQAVFQPSSLHRFAFLTLCFTENVFPHSSRGVCSYCASVHK